MAPVTYFAESARLSHGVRNLEESTRIAHGYKSGRIHENSTGLDPCKIHKNCKELEILRSQQEQ
jgi:hypothetical protein